MSAKNVYHDVVIDALVADGWTITDDPLSLKYGGRDLHVDLGAERPVIGAKKADEKIAVEIQSFLSDSPVHDVEVALGQHEIYQAALEKTDPQRKLFLAVPSRVHRGIFSEKFGKLVIKKFSISLLVFDEKKSRVLKWEP